MGSERKGLNLAVIVWQVPATGASVEYDPWTGGVFEDDIMYVTNPADDYAVEEALCIRDFNGKGLVTLIAVGPKRVEDILRRYLAMGADIAARIDIPDGRHDVYSHCDIIAKMVKDKSYDIIMCGAEVTDGFGCAAYPGPFLAGMLGVPQVSGVTRIEAGENGLVVHRKLEHGDREVVRCTLPCILTVEKDCNEPRQASLPGLIESRRKDIVTWNAESSPIDSQSAACSSEEIRFTTPHKRVKKTMTIDTVLSAADRMKMIMSGGLSQKGAKDQLLKGDINKMARDLITIFEKRGIIKFWRRV